MALMLPAPVPHTPVVGRGGLPHVHAGELGDMRMRNNEGLQQGGGQALIRLRAAGRLLLGRSCNTHTHPAPAYPPSYPSPHTVPTPNTPPAPAYPPNYPSPSSHIVPTFQHTEADKRQSGGWAGIGGHRAGRRVA